MSLQQIFHDSSFLDAELFYTLQEEHFKPDVWHVLSLLQIPTAKDLIMRLEETKREGAGVVTSPGEIYAELKTYLEGRKFPLHPDQITAHEVDTSASIGIVDCSQNTFHLVSDRTFDFEVGMNSTICESAPQSRWHTKLSLTNASFRNKYELLMRQGDRAILGEHTLLPLQVEHLGFDGEQAHLRFRSNVMGLHIV